MRYFIPIICLLFACTDQKVKEVNLIPKPQKVEINEGAFSLSYKTTSWGWNKFKKSDKLIALQLQLYKYFWSKKHNVSKDEQKNIKLCFLLLKRTAKS